MGLRAMNIRTSTTRNLAFGVCDSIQHTTASTGKWAMPQRSNLRAVFVGATITTAVIVPVLAAVLAASR